MNQLLQGLRPKWLEALDNSSVPFESLLPNSLFYSASGLDGFPIKHFSRLITSYVYTDYGIDVEWARRRVTKVQGLLGYRLYHVLQFGREQLFKTGFSYDRLMTSTTAFKNEQSCSYGGLWVVWKRRPGISADHGAEFISFVFVSGGSSITYLNLYWRFSTVPSVVAVIQPGASLSGSRENFFSNESLFARSVMTNPAGCPHLLLVGEDHRHGGDIPIWGFNHRVRRVVRSRHRAVSLWSRTERDHYDAY